MRQDISLRQRLMFSFVVAGFLPMAITALIAVPWFGKAIEEEAARALDTNASVANQMMSEKLQLRAEQSNSVARTIAARTAQGEGDLDVELWRQGTSLQISYLQYVNRKGTIVASTAKNKGQRIAWNTVTEAMKSDEATAFVAIMPPDFIDVLGAKDSVALTVKETEGGSAPQSEAEGALAIISIAPVISNAGDQSGAIVAVEVLKLRNTFVDSVVAKVGGVSTLFQNGVRVATTVKTDTGARAVGTAVSVKVRAAALDTGKPYRGEAFVVNRDYFTSYTPLRDPSGSVIGLVFVGIDKSPYTASIERFTFAMIALVIVGVLLSIAFAYYAAHTLASPLVAVGKAAERVATGDLTVTVPDKGFREARVMGRAFNTMTSGLRGLIGNVSSSVSSLNSVAGEIAQASNLEAESASSQASAVAEATATIEELNRSFAAVADGARRVLEIAEDSLEVAESGREAVADGMGHVERLAGGAQTVLSAAGSLAEVADDIDQVTFVIGSIAEQTKILALNAAIEAARAGEAGKGFSVVATEIRTLADSVTTSISQIDALVRSIQDASREIAAVADAQANMGNDTVAGTLRTRNKFDEIYERMSRTADAAREISNAASQQQTATHQIVDVMQQVSQGVSSTAASARQLADSASMVQDEAGRLGDGLQGFRIG